MKPSTDYLETNSNPLLLFASCEDPLGNIRCNAPRTVFGILSKGVFKGGVQGVQTPPEIFRFFFEK